MNRSRNRSRHNSSSSNTSSSETSTLTLKDSFDETLSDYDEDRPKSRLPSSVNRTRSISTSSSSSSSSSSSKNRLQTPPMKIYVAQKPPIDRLNLSKKRSPSLEKPSYNSDCEITDVSPLNSPQMETKHSSTKNSVRFTPQTRDNDVLDMSILMKVLNEDRKCLDLTRNHRRKIDDSKTEFQKSFDYDYDKRKEEKRKKRLAKKMMTAQSEVLSKQTRLSSAALNRLKEQQRIEKENQLILKRLLSVKPTKYLERSEQLKNYEKTNGLYPKPAKTPTPNEDKDKLYLKKLAKLTNSSTSSGCFTPLSSNISTTSSSKLTSSATSSHSRISSAKSTNSIRALTNLLGKTVKPAWNDRW